MNESLFGEIDLQSSDQLTEKIGRSFGEEGFFIVKGHEVNLKNQKEVLEKAPHFFTLPEEKKDRYYDP